MPPGTSTANTPIPPFRAVIDNISATALSRIDLTTIDQPKKAMAVQAVDMLRDKIEHGTQGYVHQILLPTLIRRGTCKEPFSR